MIKVAPRTPAPWRDRIAVATTDDRAPTEATLAALGVADLVAALVCASQAYSHRRWRTPKQHLTAKISTLTCSQRRRP